MFNLNIAITVYNFDSIELNNYLNSFKEIEKLISEKYKSRENNLINFSIVSDNPFLDINNKEFNNKLNEFKKLKHFKYYKAEKNLKRVGQVLDKIDLIDAKFIKLCDPDDIIIASEIINIAIECDNLEENSLIIYSYLKIMRSQKIIYENLENIKSIKSFNKISFNPNSIYSVKVLKEIKPKWNFPFLEWSDDVLAIEIFKFNFPIVYLPQMAPYLNNSHAGVSTTKVKHKNLSYFKSSIELINKISEIQNDLTNVPITDKPNAFLVKNVYNNLILYKTNRFNKFFKFSYFLIHLNRKINKNFISYSKTGNKMFWLKFGLLIAIIFNVEYSE